MTLTCFLLAISLRIDTMADGKTFTGPFGRPVWPDSEVLSCCIRVVVSFGLA